MTSTTGAIQWAASAGANAIEVDLQYDGSLRPDKIYHGDGACDCSCHYSSGYYVPRYEWAWSGYFCRSNNKWANVCTVLGCTSSPSSERKTCHAGTSFTTILSKVVGTPAIKLVYVDSKVEYDVARTEPERKTAGDNLAKVLHSHLFSKGYKGKVVVNSYVAPEKSHLLQGARDVFNTKSYKDRIIYAADGASGTSAWPDYVMEGTVDILGSSGYKMAYTGGVSVCHPIASWGSYLERAKALTENEPEVVIGWTYDKASSLRWAAEKGISMITNHPGRFDDERKRAGVALCT